jgi:hypothetical protein
MYSSEERETVMPNQAFFDEVGEAVREELLKPLGVIAPALPIVASGNDLPFNLAGSTRYDVEGRKPVRHYINTSPLFEDCPVDQAGTLAHEIIHAALPFVPRLNSAEQAHGPEFAKIATAIGLAPGVAGMASSIVGPQFRQWFNHRFPQYATPEGKRCGPFADLAEKLQIELKEEANYCRSPLRFREYGLARRSG